jgi:hypothetical protein
MRSDILGAVLLNPSYVYEDCPVGSFTCWLRDAAYDDPLLRMMSKVSEGVLDSRPLSSYHTVQRGTHLEPPSSASADDVNHLQDPFSSKLMSAAMHNTWDTISVTHASTFGNRVTRNAHFLRKSFPSRYQN